MTIFFRCNIYFQTNLTKERRRKGISPELPPASDRERIKAEYMKSKPVE